MTRGRWLALAFLSQALLACQAPVRPDAPAPFAETRDPETPAAPAAPDPAPASPTTPAPVAPKPTARVALRGADVYARLTSRFADPPCIEDRVVQRWERTYSRWPPRLRSNLEAILPLMAMVVDELEVHHLPGEFALLPIVESWYRPDAGSPRSAYGMWQFTTATARNHGLRIQPGFDQRLSAQASTRAAMRYLATLQNRFGDWKLANMAFNAGEYRLMRVLAKQQAAPLRVSAASHLPAGLSMITYEHVAKVQALACLIAQPGKFGLELPLDSRIEPLQVVPLPAGVASIDVLAAPAGVDAARIRALNPAFLQGRVVAGAARELLLPRAAARRLAKAGRTGVDLASMTTTPRIAPDQRPRDYRVRRGDTLSAIAQRFGVRLRDLLQWNRIDVRALLQPGQRLQLEP